MIRVILAFTNHLQSLGHAMMLHATCMNINGALPQ